MALKAQPREAIGNAPGPWSHRRPARVGSWIALNGTPKTTPRSPVVHLLRKPHSPSGRRQGTLEFSKKGQCISLPSSPRRLISQARPLKPLKLLAASHFHPSLVASSTLQAALFGLWSLNKGRDRSWLSPAPTPRPGELLCMSVAAWAMGAVLVVGCMN